MARMDNFSVVLGGPLFRLYGLARLSDGSLRLAPLALAMLTDVEVASMLLRALF